MNVWPHKKGQVTEWIYTEKNGVATDWGRDDRKSIKLVRTGTQLAMRGIGEKSRWHNF